MTLVAICAASPHLLGAAAALPPRIGRFGQMHSSSRERAFAKTSRSSMIRRESVAHVVGNRGYLHQSSSEDERAEEDIGERGPDAGIETDSVKLLEWCAVCEQVSRFASTPMGKQQCKEGRIPFGSNLEESETLLEQTASACCLPLPLDFSGIADVSEILRSARAGAVLSVSELCMVEKLLSSTNRVYEQLSSYIPTAYSRTVLGGNPTTGDIQSSFPLKTPKDPPNGHHDFSPLLSIMEDVNFCMPLVEVLSLSLDGVSLSILDTASSILSAVRASRRENAKTLETLLLEIGERVVSAGGMDSVIVTSRRARQCIAVRASHKHLLPGGVVLDFSNSRVTVFMEPKAALELNNKEVELAWREKGEELLILKRLTQKVADCSRDIWVLLEKVTCLDVACAKAGHAHWLQSVRPTFYRKTILPKKAKQSYEVCEDSFNSFSVCIEGLSHPLLLGQALVGSKKQHIKFPITVDFKVKVGVSVIVISGPNTGGKTASMKTFGLAALMVKAGLFLPATGKAVLPWFDKILADIGDSQSLEQNLSTFSGHVRQVSKVMEAGSSQSLVLFDEIGSGTDPSEGSALAAAILQHMAERVYLTVVTTHFSKLSSFMDRRFEVASVEFDSETLRPKYKLLWGIAGQSNALDIASSLGLDENVLSRARHWTKKLAPENQEQRITQLIQPLMEQRQILKSQAEVAAQLLFDTEKLYNELAAEADDLEARARALCMQREDRVKRDFDTAKYGMEEIVSNFKGSLKSQNGNERSMSMGEALGAIASLVELYTKRFEKAERAIVHFEKAGRPSVGDSVLIKNLGRTPATVIEAPIQKDDSFLVQLGRFKLRAKLSEVVKVLQKEQDNTV